MCNLRYYDCHSGQDTQMLYVLVKLDEVIQGKLLLDYIVFAMNSVCFYYSLNLQITYIYSTKKRNAYSDIFPFSLAFFVQVV